MSVAIAQQSAIYSGKGPDGNTYIITFKCYSPQYALAVLELGNSNNAMTPLFFAGKEKFLGSDAFKFSSSINPRDSDYIYILFTSIESIRFVANNGLNVELSHTYKPYVKLATPCLCMNPNQALITIKSSLEGMLKSNNYPSK
ncbi:hypothetical protein [Larkinella rosea]|uniref:Uncharacterized protein n=1 Tax=Larkinella rosea TaxID=2025312 RepID=A0A3P1BS17_9BACT|nr:hypothetical protein [Larkinella rosea]RRB03895.1 hypothetical protein EHT25_10190 [Larkinella rosea]